MRRGVAVGGLDDGRLRRRAARRRRRLEGGERLAADLVVDAMGRRSPMTGWLAELADAPIHEESEDSGFLYYTRFFRSRDGGRPPFRSAPLTPIGSFSILVLPSDNDTWSVTLYTAAGDRPLKRLRDAERWEAVVAACPAHAQWLDGEPITGVLPMGGIIDRYRRLVADGRPAVTGVALLGDAWACVNPSSGRGMTLGMLHAQHLRDLVARGDRGPRAVRAALGRAHRDASGAVVSRHGQRGPARACASSRRCAAARRRRAATGRPRRSPPRCRRRPQRSRRLPRVRRDPRLPVDARRGAGAARDGRADPRARARARGGPAARARSRAAARAAG